ncbi:subtype I-C CRISPR-associated endonuclease Cas1 [Candidatus Desantisbacteria bacterium CG_4_10_14_0_8_um_filter_48_22]|uniref:CRISPR-associated endonuclease Cas1 n=1 Tax=Candidatus Desantisbacteria bacterium CG_4_10_14_0_8_um_filter_48_22 TaxID=1974543 RepID=A0A2M7SEJ6_9BACT|nr:MAG: subtype I-C CRISPR-associated endonuclease Cas1 [Candidatus Desantisbacteria bacterium CG_4_10_14_0_8_um_filter_48_22]
MKKYLNTLFITTQGAYLSKEGETVIVSVDKEVKLQIPIHTIWGIVCFGQVSMSPYLMGFCAENKVAVSFLTEYGHFLASVQGKVSGNVLLRREQYRSADDIIHSSEITKSILTGKISNCRAVLQRALRDHSEKINAEEITRASTGLSSSLNQVQKVCSLDELRGIEGEAANTYFGVFDHLIIAQKDDFRFDERNRRPPLDEVNCLLSFLYTILMHDVRSALESVGLDSCVGFLHRDRPGRPSLALDIIEEFRPFLVDRLVLSLINREQVHKKGFKKMESGAVLMDDDTRKEVLVAYQKRKQEEIMHPYLKENIQVGLVFYIQALLLARHLRGDIDGYPVFIWK